MENRNKFLEMDGLYWESDTHEWFHDKDMTKYAHKKSISSNVEQNDALTNLYCFVVRSKSTGEYDRVVMDKNTNEIVFSTKVLEDLAFFIDKHKVIKRFN